MALFVIAKSSSRGNGEQYRHPGDISECGLKRTERWIEGGEQWGKKNKQLPDFLEEQGVWKCHGNTGHRRKAALCGEIKVMPHIILGTEKYRPIVQWRYPNKGNKSRICRHLYDILGTRPRMGSPVLEER